MTPEQYARAKALFAEASKLPPEDREGFMQQHAGESPDVLAEVSSLLKHHTTQTLLAIEDETLPRIVRPPTRSTTWGSTAVGGLPFRLGRHGYLALGIAATCLLLGIVNYLTRLATESTLRELRSSYLLSSLDMTVEALELWIAQEKTKINTVARDPELRRHTRELVELSSQQAPPVELKSATDQTSLNQQLDADFGPDVRYAVWDRRLTTIADWSPDRTGVGTGVTSYGAALLTRVFDGETVIIMAGGRNAITKDYPHGPPRPSIGVVAPIRGDQDDVIAAILVYGTGAEERFNDMLSLVQFGDTGETYAFNRMGLMLSESRFGQQLIDAGLITEEDGGSTLNVYIRDPGGDLTKGFRPTLPPETWRQTDMARFATRGKDGINLDGYRDYRGVTVAGAWKWLDEYKFGIATEIDVVEMNSALRYLKLQSAFKFGLLAIALGTAIASYYSLARHRRGVGTQSQVGQYTLEEKIGEGGMGVVYRARHALLKRPTAIKLLKADVTNSRTVAWFEREVQLASQLTHPNTIAIYDYGITPEGLFYYVMEYLDGVNLVQVTQQSGPLASNRVIKILQQIGGSLREAHHVGLVHRDVKPHNIMLCQRACETDVVKVLDFGLVKEIHSESHATSTILAGTPLYMAPERISSPGHNDPRIDLYGLGAVGFYLLVGRPMFEDGDPQGVLHQVINTVPPRVTDLVDTSIPDGLADLIASCLAKDPGTRPADMNEVLAILDDVTAVRN